MTCTWVLLWARCACDIPLRPRAAIGAVWHAFRDMVRPFDPRLADRDGAFGFGARPETARGARGAWHVRFLTHTGVFLWARRARDTP